MTDKATPRLTQAAVERIAAIREVPLTSERARRALDLYEREIEPHLNLPLNPPQK